MAAATSIHVISSASLGTPSRCQQLCGVDDFGGRQNGRDHLGEHRRQPVCADASRFGHAGDRRDRVHENRRIPGQAVQAVAADLRRHSLIPGREQMHTLGRPHDHRDRGERKDACPAELARARHITHVADPAEHQSVHPLPLHAGEDLGPPVAPQPGEVDTRVIFQRHRSDEQPTVARNGTHADSPNGS